MDNGNTAKICTNKDTGIIKIIAFITMLTDHIGYTFFTDNIILRIIGRIAFPLFVYCLVIGFIYTKDIKKYAARVFLFAISAQPFYTLLFFPDFISEIKYPENCFSFLFWIENFQLNVGFTLLLGLLALYGIKNHKYLITVIVVILGIFGNFEYGIYGIILIAVMYFLISGTKANFGIAVGIFLLLGFISDNFISETGITLHPQGFAVLALPFMLFETKSNIKIPRLVNYGFYPLHIAAIYFIKLWLQ